MEDQDDLDILACLVDSDSEFLNDDDQEVFMPSSSSLCSPFQLERQSGVQENLKNASTSNMEEMAAKMANMEQYIQQLERKVASQEASPPSAESSFTARKSDEATDEMGAKCKQFNKNTTANRIAENLLSKGNGRIAHIQKPSNVQMEATVKTCSSTKRKADDHLESTRKKSAGELRPNRSKAAESLGPKENKPGSKSLGQTNKRAPERLVHSRGQSSNEDKDVTKETFSGLRIVKPLISSVAMEKKMEGRRFVKVSQIPSKIKGQDIEGDWVTIGVMVQKLPPKKSSNGKTYGIWKLSDLGPNTTNEIVALFLFGEVYKEHWKTTEGSVVALLNCTILPAREKNSSELALTLDNAKKLMLLGISKDLGRCKGTRASDDQPCRNFVNRQHGEYCEYHIQAAYKKMKAQRMECQMGSGISEKAPLMKTFRKDLSSSTFMYQGRTVTASNQDAVLKQKNVTLKNLDKGSKTSSKGDVNLKKEKKSSAKAEPSEFFLELLSMPSVGTRNLIRHLNQDEEQKKREEEKTPSRSASELLKAHEKIRKNTNLSSTSTVTKPLQETTFSTPVLGRGLPPGSDIFFDESPCLKKRKESDVDKAKLKAVSLIKQRGPIEKENPNAVRKKPSPKARGEIERRVGEDSGKENSEESSSQHSTKKRRRILGPEFGAIDLNSTEGKALLAAKSLHVGAVQAAEAEKEEQYFHELEKKEQLEDKMKSIMEMKVRVIFCKQCNYVAESASEFCYKEKHSLKYSKSIKKFFACKECKQRTVTYGAPIPRNPCKNCGASNYEKTSMYKEKEGPKIGRETLQVRGEEQPKFLNSLK